MKKGAKVKKTIILLVFTVCVLTLALSACKKNNLSETDKMEQEQYKIIFCDEDGITVVSEQIVSAGEGFYVPLDKFECSADYKLLGFALLQGGTYTASLYDFSAEGAKTAKCDMRFCAVYQSLWTPKDRT